MKAKFFLLKFFLIINFIATINLANAQSQSDSIANLGLYNEITHMDSIVFNAFNTRNVDKFKTLFTEDLEFYHDKGGLTNYEHTIEHIKNDKQECGTFKFVHIWQKKNGEWKISRVVSYDH